jgi:hypothetical protein
LRSFRTTFTPYSHTSALADGEVGLAGGRLEFIRFTTGSTMPGQAQWLNDERTYPFWTAVAEAGTPVCVPLLDTFGASRIAWGSNFPAAEQPLGALAELARTVLGKLPAADRDAIFSGTARALYPALA